MVLHFNSHQHVSSSHNRGDIHPKTQPSGSDSVPGPIGTALRRFPQTLSKLSEVRPPTRVMPIIQLAFLFSLMVSVQNSQAREANADNTAAQNLKQLSL